MNPQPAFKNTTCDNCCNPIPEDDDVFFHDGCKLCEDCADDEDCVCDCGQYKNPDYVECYNCKTN